MMSVGVLNDFLGCENLHESQLGFYLVVENTETAHRSTLIAHEKLNATHIILREVETANCTL
jgi:hypothetical protein